VFEVSDANCRAEEAGDDAQRSSAASQLDNPLLPARNPHCHISATTIVRALCPSLARLSHPSAPDRQPQMPSRALCHRL